MLEAKIFKQAEKSFAPHKMLIAKKMREGTRTNIHKNGKISKWDKLTCCIWVVINNSMFKVSS